MIVMLRNRGVVDFIKRYYLIIPYIFMIKINLIKSKFFSSNFFKYSFFLFAIFFFMYFYFFYLSDSVWSYLDNAYQIMFLLPSSGKITSLFTIFNFSEYFSYDISEINFARYTINLFEYVIRFLLSLRLANALYYSLYFFMSFYFCSEFLMFLDDKKEIDFKIYILSLLYAVNPISVFFMNLSAFIFAYPSFFIILKGLIKYFSKYRRLEDTITGLIYIFIGLNFAFSYQRVTVIYLIILVVIFFTHLRVDARLTIKSLRLFELSVLSVLSLLPAIPSYLWNGLRNLSILNYSNKFYSSEIPFMLELKEGFIRNFSLRPIYPHFNSIPNSLTINLFIFFILLMVIAIAFYSKAHNLITNVVMFVFLISGLLLNLSFFIDVKFYNFISFKVLPFLQNCSSWALLITVIFIVMLINYLYDGLHRFNRTILNIAIASLLILSFIPLVIPNVKTEKISKYELSKVFYNYAFQDNSTRRLVYPSTNLYLNGLSYPLELSNIQGFSPLFSSNERYVPTDSLVKNKLHSSLYPGDTVTYCKYGVEEVVVFKNIGISNNKFNFYQDNNLIALSINNLDLLDKSKYYTEVFSNDYFTIFRSTLFGNSPSVGVYNSYNNLKDDLYCVGSQYELSGVNLVDKFNETVYLLRIPNQDTRILRLYKQYYPSWKLIFVEKSFYDVFNNGFKNASILEKFLIIKKLLEISDNTYVHTVGAVGENIWDLSNTDETYYMLFNQKNVYYFLSQILSLLYLTVLIVIYIFILLSNIIKKIKHE